MNSDWSIAPRTARRTAGLSNGGWMQLKRITEMPPITSGRNCTRALARSIGNRSVAGFWIQSTSPLVSAFTAVALSGMTCHSTRSKCATFGPAVNVAGPSLRGT